MDKISPDSTLTLQEKGTVLIENITKREVSKEQAISEVSGQIEQIRNSRINLQAQLNNCDVVETDLQQKLASLVGA